MTDDPNAAAPARARRMVRVGRVVSDRMDKTRVVAIERLVRHPEVGRYVRRRTKFKVHDENNESRNGDVIRFMETRRMSTDWICVRASGCVHNL